MPGASLSTPTRYAIAFMGFYCAAVVLELWTRTPDRSDPDAQRALVGGTMMAFGVAVVRFRKLGFRIGPMGSGSGSWKRYESSGALAADVILAIAIAVTAFLIRKDSWIDEAWNIGVVSAIAVVGLIVLAIRGRRSRAPDE